MADLSELDVQVLAFEKKRWQSSGAKASAIRDLFGMTETRYYQSLNVLIDRPEALVAEPVLVNRLRRLREGRAGARNRARLG